MSIQIDEQFLNSQFDALNEMYFGGKVPKPINFAIIKSKRLFGKCEWYEYQGQRWYELSISDYYERTRRGYINTLIHEMIHAYLWEMGKDYLGHGEDFLSEAERINQYGYNINPKDDCDDLLVMTPSLRNLIFGKTKSGKSFVMAYAKSSESYYRNYFERNRHRFVKTHWITAKTKLYGSLPVCRTQVKGKCISRNAYGKI